MNMSELIEAAGGGQVTARFVRFLISEGVIPAPTGGRAHASYDADHLHGIISYVRLRGLGLSPAQVKSILQSSRGETVPLTIAPGVSLHIDLRSFDLKTDITQVGRRVEEALANFIIAMNQKGHDHADAA